MVTPQANKHHMSSRIRGFYDNLRNSWTSRFKIYKDLYSCPPDLWPVAGPSQLVYTELAIARGSYSYCIVYSYV